MFTLLKNSMGNISLCLPIGKALLFSVFVMVVTGCADTNVTFAPSSGTYTDEQIVQVKLPSTATNVYLTTDSLDPEPNNLCAYSGENLTIDRPTMVKITYDVNGKHYEANSLYIIESNITDHGYTNRKVISTWEHFFVKHITRQFNPSIEEDSTLSIEDGKGGSVTLDTSILERSQIGDFPEVARQYYSFNYFNKTDDDTGENVIVNSGIIHGYLDNDSGYYSSSLSKGGSPLSFTGTYTGWADGDFTLRSGVRNGYYEVYCTDIGCATNPMYYALGSANQFIEIDPNPDANTRSCQPVVIPEV